MKKIVAGEYARLQLIASELVGCCEGSDEEQELIKAAELLAQFEVGTGTTQARSFFADY